METFRCPTCVGVLADARAPRCPHCRQRLRRKRPRILGENTRIGAANLPVDRWMLERLHRDEPASTVGALALGAYTHPVTAPPRPAPQVASATATRSGVPHDDLDPDVRAIVDDLYERARAELSGTELSFFTPAEPIEPVEHDPSRRDPEPPADPPAPPQAPRGWVPAFTTDERDRRP